MATLNEKRKEDEKIDALTQFLFVVILIGGFALTFDALVLKSDEGWKQGYVIEFEGKTTYTYEIADVIKTVNEYNPSYQMDLPIERQLVYMDSVEMNYLGKHLRVTKSLIKKQFGLWKSKS